MKDFSPDGNDLSQDDATPIHRAWKHTEGVHVDERYVNYVSHILWPTPSPGV